MKAPGAVVPALIACTTWMPFATVSAPGPPALVIAKRVAGGSAAVDDELVRGRIVGAKKGVQRDGSAGSHVAVDGQRPELPCRKPQTGRHRSRIGDGVQHRSGTAQGSARFDADGRQQLAGQVDGALGDRGHTSIGVRA